MNPYGNYADLRAIHRARLESARTSAAAAGLGRQRSRSESRLVRILRSFVPGRARGATRPVTSPDSLFWA